MCGIAGIFSPDQHFTETDVRKMTDSLQHRGPDFGDVKNYGAVCLGHRRLSIIDLSAGANQPMTSANDRYVIVYNGEVYNFREIAGELGLSLKTGSDTEVVLEAYAKWGDEFINKLNGMFAIAIFDKKENCIHLWRDRIGIKPLFYYYDGKNFAFASEIKALLKLPISKAIDREALQDYLFLEYIPEPKTIFSQIYKLEKGHKLTISSSGIDNKCYYDLLTQLTQNPIYKTENDYLEELDSLLGKSVKRRMVSDVPIGAFLSGGTDSSAICAKFGELSTDKINTYTIGFTEKEFDESKFAKEVSQKLQTVHHQTIIDPADSITLIDNIHNYYDQPFAVSSVIPMLLVSRKASEDVKVVLSGDGGDELFMGYGYYNWNDRLKKVSQFGGSIGRKLASTVLNQMDNRSKRASRIFNYSKNSSLWLHAWSQEQDMFSEHEISKLTGSKYQNHSLLKDWNKINSLPLPDYDKIALFDIKHYLANNLLHKVDIATMSTGLEARVPFLDHELVQFAINLPNEYKIRNGTKKYLLKKWLEKHLPNELVYRQKWGFPAPINHWLKKELRYLIGQYLSKEALSHSANFDYKHVQQMVKEFESGREYHYKRIWALICFQMWHEKYMD